MFAVSNSIISEFPFLVITYYLLDNLNRSAYVRFEHQYDGPQVHSFDPSKFLDDTDFGTPNRLGFVVTAA